MANLIDDEITLADGAPSPTQKLKSFAGAKTAISDLITFLASYTLLQWLDAIRKTLNPYELVTYLPVGGDFTTALIPAATPTKVILSTTIKYQNGVEINPTGGTGGTGAFEKTSAGTQKFDVTGTTGMQTSANNTIVRLCMYRNGVLELGICIPRKVETGTDTGALALHGVFEWTQGDYVEIFLETSLASTITFIETSIDIRERN